jgi:hypothetical protein
MQHFCVTLPHCYYGTVSDPASCHVDDSHKMKELQVLLVIEIVAVFVVRIWLSFHSNKLTFSNNLNIISVMFFIKLLVEIPVIQTVSSWMLSGFVSNLWKNVLFFRRYHHLISVVDADSQKNEKVCFDPSSFVAPSH